MIHTGDCIEVMRGMEADSVDAVVTDPPYGLEFMGRSWDRLGDVGTTSHSGPASVAGGERGQYGKVSYSGSANKKCRTCGKWAWDHEGRKCECEVPDFPNVGAHQGKLMQDWHYNWAVEALRVTKPGGYLLAFGGTRTHHRLVCGLEDAGWIIRDELTWIYASGFPKGKANLKPAHEPIVLARKPGLLQPLQIDATRIGVDDEERARIDSRSGGRGAELGTWQGPGTKEGQPGDLFKSNPSGRWPSNVLLSDPELFDEPNPYVVGSGATTSSNVRDSEDRDEVVATWSLGRTGITMRGHEDTGGYSRFFAVPRYGPSGMLSVCQTCGAPIAESSSTTATPPPDTAPPSTANSATEPSGPSVSDAGSRSPSPETDTAPKPAQTRLDGTLDSTATEDDATPRRSTRQRSPSTAPEPKPTTTSQPPTDASSAARSDELIDTTTTTPSPSTCASCADAATLRSTPPPRTPTALELTPAAQGNYPIGLIIPKADRADREPIVRGQLEGQIKASYSGGVNGTSPRDDNFRSKDARENLHPTVKPTDLMRHLVRLVTPPGGTVLDPFLGSGSTAIAAELEGFPWIGIEKEPEYVAIAEARLNGTQRGLGLDVPAPTRKPTTGRGDGKDWSSGPVHGQDGVTGFVNRKPTGRHYADGPSRSARPQKPKPKVNAMWPDEEPAA